MQKQLRYSLLALATLTYPLAALANGSIGIAAEVATSGIFSPTLESFTLTEVHPDSAAEAAGLQVGDSVVAIDHCGIPGCPASEAKTLMTREPGEILPLTIQRADSPKQIIEIIVR